MRAGTEEGTLAAGVGPVRAVWASDKVPTPHCAEFSSSVCGTAVSELIGRETQCRLLLTPTRGPSSITTSRDSSGPSQCPELMLLL